MIQFISENFYLVFAMFIIAPITSFLISLIMLLSSKPGSDHYLHLSIIKAIKNNNHRFILVNPSLLFYNNFFYPQLLHLFFSFMSNKMAGVFSQYITAVFMFFSTIFFNLFLLFINMQYFCFDEWFYIIANVVFILNPYNVYPVNAKNVGFSCRGFGLIIGQIFTYLIAIYLMIEVPYILIFVFFVCVIFIAVLSNVFAVQYILLSAIVYLAIFRDPIIIYAMIISTLMYLLLFRNIAIQYFKSQIKHKVFYYRVLAPRYLLNGRYSIWRDLIYDIWVKLLCINTKNMKYILSNSIIIVIVGFPFLSFIIWKFLTNDVNYDYSIIVMFYAVLNSIIIFLIITTRITRFLGEPERYLEFSNGFIAILISWLYIKNLMSINILIVYSAVFTMLQIVFTRLLSGKLREHSLDDSEIEKVNSLLMKNQKDIRLFSNNINILKYFTVYGYKVFFGFNEDNISRFRWIDIFERYPFVNENMISPLIEDFKFTHMIIDKRYLKSGFAEYEKRYVYFPINENLTLFEIIN